jgi:hypothetical protein
MLVLAGAWFLNGGPSGSVGYFLFAASLYPGIFFRGRERWLMWGVVAVSGLGLLTASHFYPQLVVPFASPLDRFIDVTTGYVFAATTCFLMLVVVATAYDGERRRQEALNRELADVLELNRRRTAELQVSLAEIRTLEGLLPICASCKKIRDDRGDWQQMEVYVMGRTGATFSHGLCPDCLRSYEESPPPAAGQ